MTEMGGGSSGNYDSGGWHESYAYTTIQVGDSSYTGTATGNPLKFMVPGSFCPDVCGIEDFGEADTWRGKVVRGFFKLMRYWPKPGVKRV